MDTDELTERVRQHGNYETAESARQIITEVLTVLSTRELRGEGADLAAQLPGEYGPLLRAGAESPEQFGADEFLARVQARLDSTEEQAQTATRAVLSSITDAVSQGEETSFMNALPTDLSGYARGS